MLSISRSRRGSSTRSTQGCRQAYAGRAPPIAGRRGHAHARDVRSRAPSRIASAAFATRPRRVPLENREQETPGSRGVRPRGQALRLGGRSAAVRHPPTGEARRRSEEGVARPSCVLGHTAARFSARPHWTMTSAVMSGTTGSSRRRRIMVPPSNGRLATTLNGSCGSGTRRTSSTWTSTAGYRRLRPSASCASISTTTTRAPARTSGVVSRPVPAPRSRTRSSG